jgi:cytochrome c
MPDFEKGNESKGAKIFKTKCSTCHTIHEGGQNKQGPNLFNIIGRKAGQVDNFNYTKANKNSGITWTNETLFDYLTNPKKYIKGTNMLFSGIKKEKEKVDLNAFLNKYQSISVTSSMSNVN